MMRIVSKRKDRGAVRVSGVVRHVLRVSPVCPAAPPMVTLTAFFFFCKATRAFSAIVFPLFTKSFLFFPF